jgi:ribonuclease HI
VSRVERVVVHVDGGARGNPGPAGIGIVISDPSGNVLARANDYIGEATNNVAEYRALLFGLKQARELGASEVRVVNDSELVARQVAGEYKVKKAELRPLHAQAIALLSGFDQWSISSVPRAENEVADLLVNDAIDARGPTV